MNTILSHHITKNIFQIRYYHFDQSEAYDKKLLQEYGARLIIKAHLKMHDIILRVRKDSLQWQYFFLAL